MKFKETKLKGAYIVEIKKEKDKRGFFARSFCRNEFESNGLNADFVQNNISSNSKKGTLRGMHYQVAPHEEVKLVSCLRGAIYDVIIDMRPSSSTYCRWVTIELTAENYRMLYIPVGFAHGFQTLKDNTVVFYQMSEFYHPKCARGVSWDDSMFSIKWPIKQLIISSKDKSYKSFNVCNFNRPLPIDYE